MKKFIAVALIIATSSASAMTFWSNGVLMGTVCRAGLFWTNYPAFAAQPVGSSCPVRDPNGFIIAQGVVTNE